MKFVKFFLCFLLFGIVKVSFSQGLHFDQYTTDDGLPSNTVYQIVQDSSGLIWMGTENGLVSYDGVSFKRFSNTRLRDNDILKLTISKDGHVTFSNVSNQYCRLEGSELVIVDVNFRKFHDIRSTKNHDFIISFNDLINNTLYKYEDSLILEDIGSFLAIDFDLGKQFSLFNHCDDSNNTEENADIANYYFPSYEFGQASVFKAKIDNQYYVWREAKIWQVDSTLFNDISLNTSTYLFEGDDMIFITTSEGLVIYDYVSSESKIVLQNFEINYGFIDKEKNIWLSTVNDGVLKIINYDFEILSAEDFGEDLRDVKQLGESILSFSFSHLNIYNNSLELVSSIPFEFEQDRHLLLVDEDIYIVDYSLIRKFDINGEERGVDESSVLLKVIDKIDEHIYIANQRGFYRLNKSVLPIGRDFKNFIFISDLNRINVIEGSNSNRFIFVGADNGLFRFEKENIKSKPSISALESKNIRSLALGDSETLWIGTSNDGLYSLDKDEKIDSIDIFNCIGSNVINDIVQYDNYLFVATASGVARYDLSTESCSVLNEYRGLLTNSIRKIFVKSLDSIFITQNKELIMINNTLFDKPSINPILVLKDIYVNNKRSILKDLVLSFAHDDNNIEFQFDYFTYRNVGNKMLQYKFSDDSLWITSNDLNLRFPSLEPSTYSLDVRGRFANIEHTDTRSFVFTVNPPWWETLWARFLGLCIAGFMLYMYISRRSRRVREQELLKRENLEQLEASKRDYLQQINKVKDQALQLQMNPHFIFNAMNAIQNFITSGREKDATIYLAKFAKLIRLIFEYSNANLITIEAELEFLKLYIELEQLRFQGRVKCVLEISDTIEDYKDFLRVPPLLIQPIIENSFKHGLFHKLDGGVIDIRYDLVGNTIITVIEDNGIGRASSRDMKSNESSKERHSGLKNIKERLEIFKFNMPNDENIMLIEDLFCEGKPSGTRTTIKVTIDENK